MTAYTHSMVQGTAQGKAGTLPISSSGQPALLSYLISHLPETGREGGLPGADTGYPDITLCSNSRIGYRKG